MAVAACIETPTEFARYQISDAPAIPLGTLMVLSGANLIKASSANSEVWAGIAWEEKTAADGLTNLTCAINGVWDLTVSGTAVTLGALVALSGATIIRDATEAEEITGDIIGKALQAGTSGDAVRIRVGRTC